MSNNTTNGAATKDFIICDDVLIKYVGTGGDVIIPDGVTVISNEAFVCRTDLASVTIPDSVTSIGAWAFCNCTGLTSVTIGSGVTYIGDDAFTGCTGLTEIAIPDSVTEIGEAAFRKCTGLTSVTIGNGVTSIGDGAFTVCDGLTSVIIPDSVTEIGAWAFCNCTGLTSVTIGSGVTSIGWCAFAGCTDLTEITIPDSVTEIGANAFLDCKNLTIHGTPGSAAETYAKKDNIPFIFKEERTMSTTETIPETTNTTTNIEKEETAMTEKLICAHCGNEINGDDYYTVTVGDKEVYYCTDCATECEDCGEVVLFDDAIEYNGEFFCRNCTSSCACCGNDFPTMYRKRCDDDEVWDEAVCPDCYDNNVYRCNSCGGHFLHEESVRWDSREEVYYCTECQPYGCIGDYHDSHQDAIIFYPEKSSSDRVTAPTRKISAHIGGEIEVDTDDAPRLSRSTMADHIVDIFDDPRFFHFEDDGSLSEDGWENITQPCTLEYWLSIRDKVTEMFRYLVSNKMSAHNVGTCGLHFHIDRVYFGNEVQQDAAIAKLLYIFEKFRTELIKFSRRSRGQIKDWTKFLNVKERIPQGEEWIKNEVDKARRGKQYDRYMAVNLTNEDTVEIRLWRGTLNINTFYATLKFTFRLAELCKTVHAIPLAKMSWEEILGDDPEILAYWDIVKDRSI